MATSILEHGDMIIIHDTDLAEVGINDVLHGPCTLFDLFYKHDTTADFIKLYDAEAPTIGTTPPEEIIRVENEGTITFNNGKGRKFENGLSMACVTTGGTAGTTGPTTAGPIVTLRMKRGVN